MIYLGAIITNRLNTPGAVNNASRQIFRSHPHENTTNKKLNMDWTLRKSTYNTIICPTTS